MTTGWQSVQPSKRPNTAVFDDDIGEEFIEESTPFLRSREARRAVKRYQTSGLVILIDHSNLEITFEKMLKNSNKQTNNNSNSAKNFISYGYLVDIIARRGDRNAPRRRVLRTYLVTSKVTQTRRNYIPSESYLKKYRIICKRSPDERAPATKDEENQKEDCYVCRIDMKSNCKCKVRCHAVEKNNNNNNNRNNSMGEKGVDCMLTRLMTEEFSGINVIRLTGKKPGHRTFCLVAGDYDYVDPVRQALHAGCDVEIWFFTEERAMANPWKDFEIRNGCREPGCGILEKPFNLAEHIEGFIRKPPHEPDHKWSEASGYRKMM